MCVCVCVCVCVCYFTKIYFATTCTFINLGLDYITYI